MPGYRKNHKARHVLIRLQYLNGNNIKTTAMLLSKFSQNLKENTFFKHTFLQNTSGRLRFCIDMPRISLTP